MKKTIKPAAKAGATKRPSTYKKTDLPRTARAYINGMGGTCYTKENEAVARLIELHAAAKGNYEGAIEIMQAQARRVVALTPPDTLRDKFLAWIGVKS